MAASSSSTVLLSLSAVLLLLRCAQASVNNNNTAEIYWNTLLPHTQISDSLRAYLPSGGQHTRLVHTDSPCPPWMTYFHYQAPSTATLERTENDDEDDELHFLFLEKDLKVGMKTKKLDFVKQGAHKPAFLSRKAAGDIPFTTSKLNDIFKKLFVNPKSMQASRMKETLESCEKEANRGETKLCATSLESMADFAVSQLKTHDLRLLTYSFHVDRPGKDHAPPAAAAKSNQAYTIKEVTLVELAADVHPVACHVVPYLYAVFHCHTTANTKPYMVELVGEEDGARVSAGAVCHVQTSEWSANHPSMMALDAKPGAHICHFLSQGNYVFIPK